MTDVAQAAFGSEARDPNGPVSVVGVGRMAGEISSGSIEGLDDSVRGKVAILVSLMAGLNIALFVFNLIPLLPLDGGHVAGALWEGLKRNAARLLHRPDPGHVTSPRPCRWRMPCHGPHRDVGPADLRRLRQARPARLTLPAVRHPSMRSASTGATATARRAGRCEATSTSTTPAAAMPARASSGSPQTMPRDCDPTRDCAPSVP